MAFWPIGPGATTPKLVVQQLVEAFRIGSNVLFDQQRDALYAVAKQCRSEADVAALTTKAREVVRDPVVRNPFAVWQSFANELFTRDVA